MAKAASAAAERSPPMKYSSSMTFGTSTFLVAVGAILRYAVSYQGKGFNVHMIGVILMFAGVACAVVSLIVLMASAGKDTAVVTTSGATVVETDHVAR